MTASQRQVRANIRNAFLTASVKELENALPNYPDAFSKSCIEELIVEAGAECWRDRSKEPAPETSPLLMAMAKVLAGE